MARFLSLRAEYSVVCFEEKEPRSRGELKDPLPVLARLSRVLEDVDTTLSLRPTWPDRTTDVWVRSLRRSARSSSNAYAENFEVSAMVKWVAQGWPRDAAGTP